MSLSGALGNAVSGMLASQRQVEVISGNVSNAQTEGFTEKNAAASARVLGGRASGVQISQITRDANPFLEAELRGEQSGLRNTETKSEFSQRIQDLFGTLDSDSALPNQIADLKSKLEQLGVEPGNTAARTEVVRQAETVANQFNDLTDGIQELRRQADTQIDQAVQSINDNLQQLQQLNQDIAEASGTGDPTANLEDQRDQALQEISGLIDIQTFTRDNGAVSVFTNEGSPLLNAEQGRVEFNASGSFQPGQGGNSVTSTTGSTLGPDAGGRLGALLEVRDQTLPDLQGDIDRLAAQVREEVNAVHNQGTPGNRPQSRIEGSVRLADSSGTLFNIEAGGASNGTGGTLEVAQVDSNGNVDNRATVNLNSFGGGDAQDLANFINSEVSADITLTGGTRFADLNGQDQLVLNGDAFDTGSSNFVIDSSNANIESASIADTAQTDTDGDGTRERSLSHFAGLNNFFETPNTALTNPPPGQTGHDPNLISANGTSAANSIQVREDISENPDLISRGVANTTEDQQAIAEGDGTVAKDLAEAFETDVDFPAPNSNALPGGDQRGNLSSRTTTLGGFAADVIQFQSSEASRLKEDAEFQSETVSNLEFRAESQAGVNVDEELAQLQQFQQAFNANARLVSTAQQMFQSLSRAVA
ncbi:flagellar hook-associated protein 1 FlgK [Limimonas halophila]|uniref:Flagellar hook-associated protein 1 n=1 Tax=Limimonas halophila TaxID=1082479 RepID=A0A1G7Q6S5_9PROT|nr:flagellar hook-associated protein FlgK [Limimonas halophila]SDF93639.1 flagellar hook-associated protein 1 FlgK [Limimonas halophila]